jgi:hypothetical protein
MRALIAIVFFCSSLATAAAQPVSSSSAPSSTAAARKAAAGHSECVLSVGLCVTVPASWQRLGDVFDDLGFVVAEPHPGVDAATWPQLTIAAIDVPPQKSGNATSLDSLVEIVLAPDGSFTSAETLQRTHLILNGSNAEIVRVLLHDEAGNTGATEAIALIEGDEGLVYSIALRCAPGEFARLEAVFQKTIRSWRIKPLAAQSAKQPTAPTKPTQDSTKK